MIRVAIADDEELMRHGLRLIVDSAPDIECIGEANNGKEALALAANCDVLLLDIRMPHMDGLEALKRIVALPSKPEVLILTAFDTQSNVLAAMRNGAIGFLLKTTPPLQLLAAIRASVAGQTLLSPSVLQELLNRSQRRDIDPRVSTLSEREMEVGRLIVAGKTNQEISVDLFLSLSTVKTHVARIMDKLDCTNRVQAAIKILEAERN